MTAMYTRTGGVMSRAARQRHQSATAKYIELGASESLANKMSSLLLTRAALDIADLATSHDRDVLDTAALYSAFNDELGLFWLHVNAEDLKVKGRWQALARNNLREEFYQIRRELAAQFMRKGSKQGLDAAIQRWLQDHSADVKRFKEMVDEMKLRGPVDIAKLSVAAKTLRDLIAY
jgi:glutamate dehydrogenase